MKKIETYFSIHFFSKSKKSENFRKVFFEKVKLVTNLYGNDNNIFLNVFIKISFKQIFFEIINFWENIFSLEVKTSL